MIVFTAMRNSDIMYLKFLPLFQLGQGVPRVVTLCILQVNNVCVLLNIAVRFVFENLRLEVDTCEHVVGVDYESSIKSSGPQEIYEALTKLGQTFVEVSPAHYAKNDARDEHDLWDNDETCKERPLNPRPPEDLRIVHDRPACQPCETHKEERNHSLLHLASYWVPTL